MAVCSYKYYRCNLKFVMKNIILVLCVLCFFSCVEKKRQPAKEEASSPTFTLPAVPSQLTTTATQAAYLAGNYWQNFNFKDTSQVRKTAFLDKVFTDYLGVLMQVPFSTARKSVELMMDKAETDSLMYDCFISLSDKYLYDPNSPLRNEQLYTVVLERIIASDKVSELVQIRYLYRYDLAMKNRPGETATDFRYTLNSGRQKMMHTIQASYLLLFFNNPDCGDCKTVKQQMKSSAVITDLQQKGTLKILSLYPDKDLAVWHQHYPDAPVQWINAYDKDAVIETKALYDLKAIPTLYLLDKEKRVVLKDARFEEIEKWLLENRQ